MGQVWGEWYDSFSILCVSSPDDALDENSDWVIDGGLTANAVNEAESGDLGDALSEMGATDIAGTLSILLTLLHVSRYSGISAVWKEDVGDMISCRPSNSEAGTGGASNAIGPNKASR